MRINEEVRALIEDLKGQPGVGAEHLHHLHHAFMASPWLTRKVNIAVAQKCLHGFSLGDLRCTQARYDEPERAIYLPLKLLSTDPFAVLDSDRLTHALGRTVRRSLDLYRNTSAQREFEAKVRAIAAAPAYEHDYTGVIKERVAVLQEAEARADVAAWNTLADALRERARNSKLPAPGLGDIYNALPDEMSRYIDMRRGLKGAVYSLKHDLKVKADLSMDDSAENLIRVVRSGLDHRNALVVDAIRTIAEFEMPYGRSRGNDPVNGDPLCEVRIDLAELGLDRRIIAQSGIELAHIPQRGIDPFHDDYGQLPYVDRSAIPPRYDVFRHTGATHAYEAMKPRLAANGEPCMDQPEHPRHRLYLKALKAVYRREDKTGIRHDYRSERLAASLAMSAQANGLSTIHRVSLSPDGKQVIAVQRFGLGRSKKKAAVDVEEALSRCVEWDRRRCVGWEEVPLDSTREAPISRSSIGVGRPMALVEHPDHRLYQQALKAVYRLDAAAGRRPDGRSEKLAAALVVSARESGLSAIHRVSLSPDGEQVLVEQRRWFPCLKKTVQVDVGQALNRSLEGDRPRRRPREGLPLDSPHEPGMPRSSARRTDAPMAMVSHPDHDLYRQALNAVYGLDAELGRSPDECSEKLAASLVVSAREDGLNAIHRVALSVDRKQAFGVQDGCFPCWRKTTQVDVGQAMQTSIACASRQLDAIRERMPPPQAELRHQPLQPPHAISR